MKYVQRTINYLSNSTCWQGVVHQHNHAVVGNHLSNVELKIFVTQYLRGNSNLYNAFNFRHLGNRRKFLNGKISRSMVCLWILEFDFWSHFSLQNLVLLRAQLHYVRMLITSSAPSEQRIMKISHLPRTRTCLFYEGHPKWYVEMLKPLTHDWDSNRIISFLSLHTIF